MRAPGPVEFTRGRISGTGTGMTYDKTSDVLCSTPIAHVRIGADAKGAGAADVTLGTAGIRADATRYVRFERR